MVKRRRNPFATRAEVLEEIRKRKEKQKKTGSIKVRKELKLKIGDLERISKLQKNFKIGRPTTLSRSTIRRKLDSNKKISTEARFNAKIFRLKSTRRGKTLHVPAIPKGIRLRRSKR